MKILCGLVSLMWLLSLLLVLGSSMSVVRLLLLRLFRFVNLLVSTIRLFVSSSRTVLVCWASVYESNTSFVKSECS